MRCIKIMIVLIPTLYFHCINLTVLPLRVQQVKHTVTVHTSIEGHCAMTSEDQLLDFLKRNAVPFMFDNSRGAIVPSLLCHVFLFIL